MQIGLERIVALLQSILFLGSLIYAARSFSSHRGTEAWRPQSQLRSLVLLLGLIAFSTISALTVAATSIGISDYTGIAEGLLRNGYHYYDSDLSWEKLQHPPLFILIYAVSYTAFPFLDVQLRYKIPLLLSNALLGLALYYWGGRGKQGLLAASVLLTNPFYVLNSVALPQVDPVMMLLVITAIASVSRSRWLTGSILMGLALMTRQYAIYAVIPLIALTRMQLGLDRSLKSLAVIVLLCLGASMPFLLIGDASNYVHRVALQQLTSPEAASLGSEAARSSGFSGVWSVASLAESIAHVNFGPIGYLAGPLQLVLIVLVLYRIMTKRINEPFEVALLGLAVFVLAAPVNAPHRVNSYLPLLAATVAFDTGQTRLRLAAIFAPSLYRYGQYFTQFYPNYLGVIPYPALGDLAVTITLGALFTTTVARGGHQVVLNKHVVAGPNESSIDSKAEKLPARTKDSEPSLLVSVVIPTRNRRELVLRCLSSVYQSTHRPVEVVLVDDCSTDGTHEAIRQQFPGVRLLRNTERRLLAASRNLGLRESSGQYIFLLDDDNVVDPLAVTSLLEGMRLDERVGVVAPVTYYHGDAKRIWWAGARMNRVTSITTFPYKDTTGLTIKTPYQSQMFHNAFMMRRRVVDRVGFFDEESFPIFLSEADYSERIRRLGYRVLVVPSAKVWHDVPPPRGGVSLRAMHITDPVRAYFVARNRIILMWRYRRISEFLAFFLLFEPVIVTVQLLSILLSQIPEKAAIATGYIKGILDGVRKGFRMRRLHVSIPQE